MKVCPTYKLWVSQSVSNSIKIKYNKVYDYDFKIQQELCLFNFDLTTLQVTV
jgi:hypothetical protein